MAKQIKPSATPDLTQALSPELLGAAIKAKRTQSMLRLEDAALLCGVAKQTLMQVEHGHANTQLATLLQICHGLGIELTITPWDREQGDEWF